MFWIVIALISYICSGLGTIGDKFLIKNKIQNQFVLQIWLAFLGTISLIYIFFIDIQTPTLTNFVLLGLAETTTFIGAMLFLRALKIDDVSRVSIAWNLTPVFSLIIAWVFINETLNLSGIIALILLISGSILASLHAKNTKHKSRFRLSASLPIMVLSCFLIAIAGVTWDHVATSMNAISIFTWSYLFTFIFALCLLTVRNIRKEFFASFRTMDKTTFWGIFFTTTLGNLGYIFFMWALVLGPVSLVYALEGFQTLFVFMLSILISSFTHIRLEEELDNKNLLLKSLALVVMIAGIVMINLA